LNFEKRRGEGREAREERETGGKVRRGCAWLLKANDDVQNLGMYLSTLQEVQVLRLGVVLNIWVSKANRKSRVLVLVWGALPNFWRLGGAQIHSGAKVKI
jgi:hypothetical protein